VRRAARMPSTAADATRAVRLDVAVAWRRVDELAERTRHELWLVATWRN
jgi:hypothetical protein